MGGLSRSPSPLLRRGRPRVFSPTGRVSLLSRPSFSLPALRRVERSKKCGRRSKWKRLASLGRAAQGLPIVTDLDPQALASD